MRKYRLVAKKGEGTFSEVLKAQNVKDGKYYAIKCMKNRFDSIDQVCGFCGTTCCTVHKLFVVRTYFPEKVDARSHAASCQ